MRRLMWGFGPLGHCVVRAEATTEEEFARERDKLQTMMNDERISSAEIWPDIPGGPIEYLKKESEA